MTAPELPTDESTRDDQERGKRMGQLQSFATIPFSIIPPPTPQQLGELIHTVTGLGRDAARATTRRILHRR